MDELTRRAFAAYFRHQGEGADQPSSSSGVVEHDGFTYVVLRNVHGPMVVYRHHNDGRLRRLRRWPKEISERF